ncbi:MAG: LEA type 2 family protein [bacterium]
MKRICLSLIIVFLLSCTAVQERLAIKECKFSLISVKPYDFTFNNLKLDFDINCNNPNKIDAVLDKLKYTLYANDNRLISGTTGKGIKISAKGSNSFVTTVTLEYSKLGEALISAIRLGKVEYRVKATAYIQTIIGEISYPVEITLN